MKSCINVIKFLKTHCIQRKETKMHVYLPEQPQFVKVLHQSTLFGFWSILILCVCPIWGRATWNWRVFIYPSPLYCMYDATIQTDIYYLVDIIYLRWLWVTSWGACWLNQWLCFHLWMHILAAPGVQSLSRYSWICVDIYDQRMSFLHLHVAH